MKYSLFLFALLLLSITGRTQSSVYGVDPQSSDLYTINTTTFTSTTMTLTSTTGTVDGCNGLTSDPCSGTTYIIYKVGSDRYLGTVNLTTAVITEIGILSDNVSNIAYDYINGILYGVTGDGASTPETLYDINTSTAGMNLIMALGNGDDGEAIAFNPVDTLLYHWSGWGLGDVVMETINLSTFNVSPQITLSGDDVLNVGCALYTDGKFLVSDINDEALHWITPGGAVTTTTSDLALKGLTIDQNPAPSITLLGVPGNAVCPGDSVTIITVANGVNLSYDWLDGANQSTGITSVAFTTDTVGTFTCQITDVCGTTASSMITLTTGTDPVVQLIPNSPPTASICPNDSVLLIGSTPTGNNQWFLDGSSISGANNDSLYALTPGVYNMLNTNSDGCSDSSAVSVTVSFNSVPNVTLTPSGNASYCPGDSVELQVNTGGGTIQWYLNGSAIMNANANSYYAQAPGTYNVIKTNMSGCTDSSATPILVTESTVPSVILTPSPTVNFCSPNTIDITVNSGGGTRQWYKDGSILNGETGTTYTVSTPGVYNVIKTNMSGCSDSAAVGTTAIDTCLLSIDELASKLQLEIYPNPASDRVYLNFSPDFIENIMNISLINIEGRSVIRLQKESITSHMVEIETDNISSGLYMVEVETINARVRKKLVVE